MKKVILFVVFIGFFALVMPGTPLFADIGLGGRIDLGLDLFVLPVTETSVDDDISMFPIIPLLDMGFYGQSTFGGVSVGIGLRMFSLVYINVFTPSIYAEVNLWRFTLNAQLSGGALYLFPIYLITGPYFAPEISLWYTLNNNKKSQMRVGVGALTIMSPWNVNQEYIRDIANNAVFYLSFKIVFPSSWVTWKREI